MAHQLGAVYDTPHGLANAILLPTVMRFNGEVCADRFREILVNIGRPDAATFKRPRCNKYFCMDDTRTF